MTLELLRKIEANGVCISPGVFACVVCGEDDAGGIKHKPGCDLAQAIVEAEKVCEWKLVDDGDWMHFKTSCGIQQDAIAVTPFEDGWKGCPFCMHTIKEVQE